MIWTLTESEDYITEKESENWRKRTGKELEGLSRGREILGMAEKALIERVITVFVTLVNISIPLNELWMCLSIFLFVLLLPQGMNKWIYLISIHKIENMLPPICPHNKDLHIQLLLLLHLHPTTPLLGYESVVFKLMLESFSTQNILLLRLEMSNG